MRWFSKIPFVVLGLLILLAGARIFFSAGERDVMEPESADKQEVESTLESDRDQSSSEGVPPQGVTSETNPTTTKSPAKKVTPEECEQECEGFSTLPDEQAYCLSFCGLNQEGYQGKDCTTLLGPERDSCFKEQAIRERNPETCARIGESSLRKACEARVAEELFD